MPSFSFNAEVTLSIGVGDLNAALAWYAQHLGFQKLYVVEDIRWAEMRTHLPGVTLGIGEKAGDAKGGNTVPVFGVHDIEAARAELEGAGVRFDGKTMVIPGMVKLATFFDPWGNAMMLVESIGQMG